MSLLVGLNVGGTFSNTIVYSKDGLQVTKVPSYKGNLTRVLEESLQKLNLNLKEVSSLVISFPLAMHPVLDRSGAKTGLICTEGFIDSLDTQEGRKPYVLRAQQDKIVALIKRRHRREISARIDPDGNVVSPLDMDQVTKLVDGLVSKGVDSIAICLLFSFVDPTHELLIRDYIRKEYPHIDVCISSEVSPIIGEFRRMSTTAVNAYVNPKVRRAIDEISNYLTKKGLVSAPTFLQSSGGVITAEMAKERVVQLMWSCPAGGVMGANKFFGHYKDLITLDIGGTTTDICVIKDSEPPIIMESKVEEYLLQFPVIDIISIPLGGGSVTSVDPFGALMIGPRSAGSEPGPACYDQGGEEATVTDANLLMGMCPSELAGGEVKLKIDKAKKVLGSVAGELGCSESEMAENIYRLSSDNIFHAIAAQVRKRGYDPRDFTLVAYGGAGPTFALDIAKQLGVQRTIIPVHAGAFSGLGLLTIELGHELARSYFTFVQDANLSKINNIFSELEKKAREILRAEKIKEGDVSILKMADMRYVNQTSILSVMMPNQEYYQDLSLFSAGFHRMHFERYGHSFEKDPVELVALKVRGIGRIPAMKPERIERTKGDFRKTIKQREILFPVEGKKMAQVVDRNRLRAGDKISGPAAIEEKTCTTVIPPGMEAEVDEYGSIVVTLRRE